MSFAPAMKIEDLEDLLRDMESDRVERTSSTKDTDKFAEAICAFSNDLSNSGQPGYLFIGAKPDGAASGANITDELLRDLAAIRSSGQILPLPAMNVQKWTLCGGEMAVVEVLPSDSPPVRYKGRVCIRVGPTRAVASEQEERILAEKRTARAKTWDARPCREASRSDLMHDLFVLTYRPSAVAREVIEENDRDLESQYAALRFFDPFQHCPTHAAILLFAKDPESFVPGAYVQYVRYNGFTQADAVALERRLSGDLLSVMRGLDQLADELAGARPIAAAGLAERLVYDYPPKALHELFVNAVIHRNYEGSTTPTTINHFEDRLEILNPGGLYGDLTPEQFPRMTAYRNPILAEAAKTLGFVNRYGRGIALAQAELSRNGSPEASFYPGANHFLAIVRRWSG